MKKLYVRIIAGAIALILILIFGTGSINNCVPPNSSPFTSYFSLDESHHDDYQALYFGQSKGIFFGIYARVDYDSEEEKVKGFYLKSLNYRRTIPFTYKIGFNSHDLDSSLLYLNGSKELHFDLLLDNLWSSKDSAYIKFHGTLPNELEKFNIIRHFSPSTVGQPIKNPCDKDKEMEAVGLNCIESKLRVVN